MFKAIIWIVVIIWALQHFMGGSKEPRHIEAEPESTMTQQELDDAKEFAQNLIQRDYQCNKVSTFSPATPFRKEIVVWCDDRYEYYITKPGGRWKVEAQ